MAVAIALVLAVLAIQHGLKSDHHIDVATAEQMQQRKEYLHQRMTWLLQEVGQSRDAEEATLLSALWQCPLWPIVLGSLGLFCAVRWMAKEMKLTNESNCEEDDKEEEDDEEEEDLSGAYNGAPSSPCTGAASTPSPMQHLPDRCMVMKDLVDDLLDICQDLCKKTSMLEMHPDTGEDSTYTTCVAHDNNVVYRLLVFLQPSPGHSFSMELNSTGKLLAENPSIRVGLKCICLRKHLLGGMCFLHQSDKNLPMDQRSKLLRSLCTHSYLDMEKVARWFQMLVKTAWQLLPVYCQLTVLPSSQTCRFQLTGISNISICTEMIFAVQQDKST